MVCGKSKDNGRKTLQTELVSADRELKISPGAFRFWGSEFTTSPTSQTSRWFSGSRFRPPEINFDFFFSTNYNQGVCQIQIFPFVV